MDATQIEALKAKYPGKELHLLSGPSAEVVAKVGKAEVDLFRDLVTRDATKSRAMERFVRACVIYPAPEELNIIWDSHPALIERWGDKLLEIGGASEELEVKKL